MCVSNNVLKDIKDYFNRNNFEIVNEDKVVEYLIEDNILRTFDLVLDSNLEMLEINCPIKYLKVDKIVEDDKDYIEVGNEIGGVLYLDVFCLNDFGFKYMLKENMIKIGQGD